MGLDTTHGCWHGPYSSFHEWRLELARRAGYALTTYENEIPRTVPAIWMVYDDGPHIMGDWSEPPSDPLLVLLLHADNDGHILPEHAGPLADRLEHLDRDGWHTRRFVTGLRKAAVAGERVEFG